MLMWRLRTTDARTTECEDRARILKQNSQKWGYPPFEEKSELLLAAKPVAEVAVALQALWSAHPQASRVLSSSINMWYFVWLRHDICHIFYTRCLWQISCLTRVPVLDFFSTDLKPWAKESMGIIFVGTKYFCVKFGSIFSHLAT